MILPTGISSLNRGSRTFDAVKNDRYDAIIVGGGQSGLVAAARLSENPDKKILVIEAGSDRRGDPNIDTPGLLATLWGNPQYDWNFYTEPQATLNGRQIPQPRGKVLGGSSAINVTQIVYPTQRNFDSWSRLGQNDWTHANLAPYYRKFQDFTPPSTQLTKALGLDTFLDSSLQGTNGPIKTSYPDDAFTPYNEAWMAAFQTAGLNDTNDPILGNKLGAFHGPNSVDPYGNIRSYSASAYYDEKIESRPNLDVLTETRVTKVVLQETSDLYEARGVQVCGQDGTLHEIYADEIILAAGTFQSPQILEYSGIGNAKILQKYGIDTLVDNSGVGENLQDHCSTSISIQVADGLITGDVVRDPNVVEMLVKQYTESRRGPLSGLAMGLAYTPPMGHAGPIETDELKSLLERHLPAEDVRLGPGIKAQYGELSNMVLDPLESTLYFGLTARQMNVGAEGKTSMFEAYFPKNPENHVNIMVGLNHPFSRGSVHIASSDPMTNPMIDPGYLTHPLDEELLSRGVQFVETLIKEPALANLLQADKTIPAEANNLGDLDVARKVTKDRLWTTYHPSSTCAMLPKELGGVVNERLVVHGTKNLRVIDASVFPLITLGNIQATVYAVAERASDLIKHDWAQHKTV